MADPAYIVDGVLTDGEAWVALNSTTLGSDTATVTFKSGFDDTDTDVGGVQAWDQYMDLVLISYFKGSGTSSWDNGYIYLGTGGAAVDTTNANYHIQMLLGDGSAVEALAIAYPWLIRGTGTVSANTNVFAVNVCHMFDINSGKYKSVVVQEAADIDGAGHTGLIAGVWKNQGAIDRMQLSPASPDFSAGSTFSLFGVLPRMVA